MVVWVSWEGMTDVLLSSEMIELDGDEERISSQGRYAERDIVQVQISPRDMLVGLFSSALWSMGKGHGAWPSTLLLFSAIFLSLSCCLPFLNFTHLFPFYSVLLFHFLLSDI